jgi:hypothetical protein
VVTDPAARRVTELAVVTYELTLRFLTRFFTHTDESDSELSLMADVLRPLGVALTRLPAGPEHPGRTAGFAFEMYYAMSNFVPWREPSWALLYERMAILVQLCRDTEQMGYARESVITAGVHAAVLAERLRAHVPSRLLPAR